MPLLIFNFNSKVIPLCRLMYKFLQHTLFYLAMLVFAANTAGMAHADTPQSKPAPAFSTSQMQTLTNGKVLITVEKIVDKNGKSARMFSAVQIDASPEAIWAVLTDCARAPTYVPGLKKCEILEVAKDKSWDIRRHTNKPATFLPKMVSEFRCEYVFAKSVSFTSVGGDMDTNTGRWTLTPNKDNTKTIVTYKAQVAAKTLVPDKIIRKAMKKNIPKVMRALRDEVMKDKAALAEKTE